MGRFLVVVLCSFSVAAAAESPVDAGDPVVDPVVDAAIDASIDLGALDLGPLSAQVRQGSLLYVARQSGGVTIVDVGDAAHPVVVGAFLAGTVVSRLFSDGDRLTVLVLFEEAKSFSLADPKNPAPVAPALSTWTPSTSTTTTTSATSTTSTPATTTPPVKAQPGRVLEVVNGRAVWSGVGFKVGTRVKIISQRLVEKPDLENGGTALVAAGTVSAVIDVEEVSAERGMGVLGRGDVAFVGDVVETTELPLSESLFLPSRAPFTWRLGFHARPFFGLGSSGFPVGALVDGYVHYSFADLPIAVSLELAPLGGAVFGNDAHYPGVLALGGSYVTNWFELGLGVGGLIGNDGPCTPITEIDPDGQVKVVGEPVCEGNNGFTFTQALRLGALDGIHLAWSSSIFARAGGFVLGTGRAELGVPVSSRVGLFGAGGVGENGWAFGEIGVRTMLGGTGGPGTMILSASLGGAGVFDGPGELVFPQGPAESDVVAGPAVGFGMEWRL